MRKTFLAGFLILVVTLLALTGCKTVNVVETAQEGDTVQVHYTGTLDDGSEFDSSEGGDPLEFTIGSGEVIPGFDSGVKGMKVGESKTIHIPFADAYGEADENLVVAVPRSEIPEGLNPTVGQRLQTTYPDGGMGVVIVTEVTAESVTVDGNHPLAGKDLTFKLKLVSIKKP